MTLRRESDPAASAESPLTSHSPSGASDRTTGRRWGGAPFGARHRLAALVTCDASRGLSVPRAPAEETRKRKSAWQCRAAAPSPWRRHLVGTRRRARKKSKLSTTWVSAD